MRITVILGALEAAIAISAMAGGVALIINGLGMSLDVLEGTPFTGFFWPGVILAVAVGGSGLLAWVALLAHAPRAIEAGAFAGATLAGWIVVQVVMLGYISVLQPVMGALGLITLLLALKARRRRDLAIR
ncbi:MAG: hypothetical protein Q8M79_01885 [Dehalococcoidia bacterium]|nr:hypothetical protein [Dehalococcoidia bacterium]